jgi:hypothetical protein
MVGGTMERPIITTLNIGETLVPCTLMLRIVHGQDVHDHPIDDLCLVFCLGVESGGVCELGVQ